MRPVRTNRQIAMRLIWIGVLIWLVSGCIRPEEPTPVPSPTSEVFPTIPVDDTAPIDTPDPTAGQGGGTTSADLPAIQSYLQSIGKQISPGSLAIWKRLAFRSEQVIAISYTSTSGLPCIGVVMGSPDPVAGLDVFNGDTACTIDPTANVIGGSWLLVTRSTNEGITATVAQVLNPSQSIGAATIFYADGTVVTVTIDEIVDNRLLSLRSGVHSVNRVQFISQAGNEVEAFVFP